MGTMGTKKGLILIARCTKNGHTMWRVNVPISLVGRRMRRFFSSRRDAILWVDEFEGNLKQHGLSAIETGGKTVNEVLSRFWELRELTGRHLQTAKSVLTQFCARHGASPIRMVSPLQLQTFWTRPEWSPSHRAKAFRYLRLFFNWAERYDFIQGNPARRVEAPKVGELPKRILSPQRMAELLQIDDEVLHAFLCLGGLAGLRSSEILALSPDDLGKKEIHVKAGKTGERFVSILPAFKRHWRALPSFPGITDFYAHIRAVTGDKWPANCLRHSYGTFHLAMWQDAGKTAFQMGNSQAVVIRSYARAVRQIEARKWWNL